MSKLLVGLALVCLLTSGLAVSVELALGKGTQWIEVEETINISEKVDGVPNGTTWWISNDSKLVGSIDENAILVLSESDTNHIRFEITNIVRNSCEFYVGNSTDNNMLQVVLNEDINFTSLVAGEKYGIKVVKTSGSEDKSDCVLDGILWIG